MKEKKKNITESGQLPPDKLVDKNMYGQDSKMKAIRISSEIDAWLKKRAKSNLRSANAEIFSILTAVMNKHIDI